MSAPAAEPSGTTVGSRFPDSLLYAASTLYYLQDATQADVAARLGTSRATVSRLLSEARRRGIVRIEVVAPTVVDDDLLAERTAAALGLQTVYLSPTIGPRRTTGTPGTAARPTPGAAVAPALSTALTDVGLEPGDVLLVSSGRTVHDAARAELPPLPGVVVVPTIGGQDEPEPWFQPNEITRQVAASVGGRPSFLYAPALPGPELYRTLIEEPSIRRVLQLWEQARCAVLGVGAPPLTRDSIPRFVPTDAVSLREAVGDVCSRFYDAAGRPVPFPGVERLMATGLDVLQRVPVGIAVAVGADKVAGIVAGARAGYFNRLVTDVATARALLDAVPTSDVAG